MPSVIRLQCERKTRRTVEHSSLLPVHQKWHLNHTLTVDTVQCHKHNVLDLLLVLIALVTQQLLTAECACAPRMSHLGQK